MKHSVRQLFDVVYTYFSRGVEPTMPGYEETAEFLRQKEARVPASQRYPAWLAMFQRIRERIADQQLPEGSVESECYFSSLPLPEPTWIDASRGQ